MSDPQPWRNPRAAPRLQELQPNLHRHLIPGWLRAWWPAFVWAGVIFTFSTDSFSSEHTAKLLGPLVRWLFPSLTPHQFALVHHFIRKSAHFTEYFIFYLFIFRGIRGSHAGWRWGWGLPAWFIAAGYSCLDEIHQAFVASRTASPYDSLLDSIGALFAFGALLLWFHFHKPEPAELEQSAPTSPPAAF